MRIFCYMAHEIEGEWVVEDIEGLEPFYLTWHQQVRRLKISLPTEHDVILLFCATLTPELRLAIDGHFGRHPVYVRENHFPPLTEKILRDEILHVLHLNLPTLFTSEVITTMKQKLSADPFVFEANVDSKVNANRTVRADLVVRVDKEKTEYFIVFGEVRQRRPRIRSERMIQVESSSMMSRRRFGLLNRSPYRLHWSTLFSVEVIGWLGDRYQCKVYPRKGGDWSLRIEQLERKRSEMNYERKE